MPKSGYAQAPLNFQCPYRHNCPHLYWSSTHWIWSEYERSGDEHFEHWRIRDDQDEQLQKALAHIKELEKKNDELNAQLTALHRRQFKANKKSAQKPPSHNRNGPKKRGAPIGHPGWFRRKPSHIDKTIAVPAPDVCPHCASSDLKPVEGIKEHLQEDIVLQPCTQVTCFKHHQAFCPKCRRAVIQAADGELLNCHIGPVTKATAIYLRYGLNLPYRKVNELFNTLFDMPFVPASAMAFDRTATTKGRPLYEDLRQKVRAAALVHADETGWRQNGINHYVWYAGNDQLAFYLIHRHRSTQVAKSIFGDDFHGVLNTDGYAAYNGLQVIARQSCLAHLIRKAKEIKQEILLKKPRHQDNNAINFLDRVIILFKHACEAGQKLLNENIHPDRVQNTRKRFYARIRYLCANELADAKADSFRRRLRDPTKEYHRLFTFLKYPGIGATNNHAERSLRPVVIMRKICFGTRSPDGSQSHSVLPSLLVTAKRQGQHPLDFFKTLLLADTTTAQAALYNHTPIEVIKNN